MLKRRIRRELVAVVATVLSGCTFPALTDPAAFGLPDAEVAVLSGAADVQDIERESDSKSVFALHGSTLGSGPFRLRPGRYQIWYGYGQNAHGWSRVGRVDTVELKAGHVYRTKGYTCPGFLFNPFMWPRCWGRAGYGFANGRTVWIEDKTTGEIVAGEKW